MIVTMAWRNLWRNKRRTIITLLSVALGVWLVSTFVGMAHHSYASMIDNSARMGFGHVTVQPKDYGISPSLEKRVTDAIEVANDVESVPNVAGTTVRISGQAMFAAAARSVGGGFLGIDPKTENADNNVFVRGMKRGKLFSGTKGRGIVIGDAMAERLGVDLKKKVVYTAIDANGDIISEVARVVGIFDTGVDAVDGSMALLPIDSMRAALGYGPQDATMVSIYVEDQRGVEDVATVVAEKVGAPGREVRRWHETQPELASMVGLDRSVNYLFQVLLGLLVAAGVLNTMLMSVLERKREFGVMMAVGMAPSRLATMVLAESIMIGLVGAVVGVVLSSPWYFFMITQGIDFSELYGGNLDTGGVAVDPVIKLLLDGQTIFAIVAGLFTLTTLAGLYPAYRAGQEVPVDALRAL